MKLISAFLLSIIVLISCQSPTKLLKSGKYKRAVNSALYDLKNERDVGENLDILNEAMRFYLEQENQEVNALLETGDIKDGEKAYRKRRDMLELMEKTKSYLDRDLTDYLPELRSLTQELKAELYKSLVDWGKEDLAKYYIDEDKSLAQSAYRNFNKAKKYKDTAESLDSLMNLSVEMGKLTYKVEVDADFSRYSWEIEGKFDNLEHEDGLFTEILYDSNESKNADCHVEIEFKKFDISDDEVTKEESFSTDVVVGTETIINDQGEKEEVNIWDEVSGKVIIHTITRSAHWSIELDVRANSKHCDLFNQDFKAEIEVEKIEYQLEGDLRAIPKEYQNQPDDPDIWEEDEIAEELINQLYKKVVDYLM